MNIASNRKDVIDAKKLLELLPDIYFAILKNTSIEQETSHLVRCTFELPLIGRRVKTAPNAVDAMRDALSEISELLINNTEDSLYDAWRNLLASQSAKSETKPLNSAEIKEDRFQAKVKQLTIGVTLPLALKSSLQDIAKAKNSSFSEVAREFTSSGFEEFDKRIFTENSKKLISEFLLDVKKWDNSESEQLMVRTDPYLGVRLRTTAKEFKRSASEFGAMCLAHGLVSQLQLKLVEEKVFSVRGSSLRKLAPQVGLSSNVALLSGVLAGSITAPRQLLKKLGEYFEVAEISLITFFKLSFESRQIPSFKAEHGKPQVNRYAISWEEAVRSSGLPDSQVQELLTLDN